MTVAAQLRARATDDRPGLWRVEDDGTAAPGHPPAPTTAWTWREVVQECAVRAAWMTSVAATGRTASESCERVRPPQPSEPSDTRPLHVGVLLDNVPELVFLLGGAALSGSVIVALNTTRSAAELAGDAARADCDLLVTEPGHLDLAEGLREHAADAAAEGGTAAGITVLDAESTDYRERLAPYTGAPLPDTDAIADETLLMLIFTSGTSGRPRAVRVTHRKVTVPGEHLAGRLLTGDDAVYCPMPLFHSGAVMAAYAPALAAGARLVVRRRFSASGLLPDVRRHGCTYLHYVGKALSYVLGTPERADDRDNPLRVAFGNEAAPLEQEAFAERFGCVVVDAYGSTETAISLSPDPFGPPGALGTLPDGVKVLDPRTGEECPPARLDDAGRVLNADEAVGELVNTGDLGLFDGYYNEDAADRLRDGMFWSGDHVYADENGHVFFVGRSLDRLRVDGENFGSVQVERALATAPGVQRIAVYGVPDAASGDQVMAAVVGDFDPEAFGAYLRSRADLSSKWMPRYVRVTTELPATASNKILKRRLAETGWRTRDPVWWRPGREPAYRRLTPEDATRLREEFERRGRLHLLADRSEAHEGTDR
ncbi:AMP-binding protein [Actinomadura sp. HBU206391]|uniref:AMP-binding protein n=1 Tax=Actinomadura sp. HBU206391 TaxID=2731692 RepID=UPI00164F1C3D|nr:AMP-binding protein [Actinomadura sp. HBU206391]MBC6462037.1 AMP-binding protein [Actinomadura sp. HBU206391]